jgi:hypothetical protein
MYKRIVFVLLLFACALALPSTAGAPATAEPQTYTFVIERTIPRAMWADWETFAEQKYKPALETLMTDGTVVSWGLYTTVVHAPGYPTHGSWIETKDIASIHKAIAELGKIPNPVMSSAQVTHRDYLLHSRLRGARAAMGTNGYLWVNNTHLQPGKGDQYRALYERNVKPILADLLADRTLVLYAMQGETIHTDDPSQIFDVYVFAGPEGQDKLYAAIGEMEKKNPTFADSLNATEVEPPHRDYLARVTAYAVQ